MAALALPILVGLAAPGAVAKVPREVVLAEYAVPAGFPSDQLTAGFGVVAWIERGANDRPRLAVQYKGRTRRAAWSGSHRLSVERRVDERTGRVVVRVVAGCYSTGTACRPQLLSPSTLARTKSLFDPQPFPYADGATKVSTAVAPVSPGPEPRSPFAGPPSECAVTVERPTVALPGLPDCSGPLAMVRGRTLAVRSGIPSQSFDSSDTPPSITYAWDAISLNRVSAGWLRLGTSTSGKGGTMGIQAVCQLDDAVAVLNGSDDAYDAFDGPDPSTVSISVRPLDGGPALALPTPGSAARNGAFGTIACSRSTVYASYLIRTGPRAKAQFVARVARLVPSQ